MFMALPEFVSHKQWARPMCFQFIGFDSTFSCFPTRGNAFWNVRNYRFAGRCCWRLWQGHLLRKDGASKTNNEKMCETARDFQLENRPHERTTLSWGTLNESDRNCSHAVTVHGGFVRRHLIIAHQCKWRRVHLLSSAEFCSFITRGSKEKRLGKWACLSKLRLRSWTRRQGLLERKGSSFCKQAIETCYSGIFVNSSAHLSQASISRAQALSSLRDVTMHGALNVRIYTLETDSTLEMKLISPKYMLLCFVQLNALLSQKWSHQAPQQQVNRRKPRVVFDNHPIIDWPSWPIIWMTLECINVTFKSGPWDQNCCNDNARVCCPWELYSHWFWYPIGYDEIAYHCQCLPHPM